MSRVFTVSLRVVCEHIHRFRKITGSVNEPKSRYLDDSRNTLHVYFPESLCERGFITLVRLASADPRLPIGMRHLS